MKKKAIIILIGMLNLLNAESIPQSDNTNQPQVLAYQEILKNIQGKTKTNMPAFPPDDIISANIDLNVIGTININNNKYCYLLVESNKVIKATIGMVIKNKKIEDINEFGVTFNDKSKNSLFLPILTSQTNEADIVFSNKENKSHNTTNQ